MASVPDDVWLHILDFSKPKDAANCRLVSRAFSVLATPSLARNLYLTFSAEHTALVYDFLCGKGTPRFHFMRHLELSAYCIEPEVYDYDDLDAQAEIMETTSYTLYNIIQRAINLHSIHFTGDGSGIFFWYTLSQCSFITTVTLLQPSFVELFVDESIPGDFIGSTVSDDIPLHRGLRRLKLGSGEFLLPSNGRKIASQVLKLLHRCLDSLVELTLDGFADHFEEYFQQSSAAFSDMILPSLRALRTDTLDHRLAILCQNIQHLSIDRLDERLCEVLGNSCLFPSLRSLAGPVEIHTAIYPHHRHLRTVLVNQIYFDRDFGPVISDLLRSLQSMEIKYFAMSLDWDVNQEYDGWAYYRHSIWATLVGRDLQTVGDQIRYQRSMWALIAECLPDVVGIWLDLPSSLYFSAWELPLINKIVRF